MSSDEHIRAWREHEKQVFAKYGAMPGFDPCDYELNSLERVAPA